MVNKRNPSAARRAILDAAARAFAGQGPAGARIDAIAAEAGVNKRMLYHYFGDKNALFEAVLKDRLGDDATGRTDALTLTDAHARSSTQPGAADAVTWDVLDLRLMVWAAIDGKTTAQDLPGGWGELLRRLESEQRAGRWRDDVDAATLAVVLFALSALPKLLPQLGADSAAMRLQLQRLLGPSAAPTGTVSRAGRPRIRMQPEVRSR